MKSKLIVGRELMMGVLIIYLLYDIYSLSVLTKYSYGPKILIPFVAIYILYNLLKLKISTSNFKALIISTSPLIIAFISSAIQTLLISDYSDFSGRSAQSFIWVELASMSLWFIYGSILGKGNNLTIHSDVLAIILIFCVFFIIVYGWSEFFPLFNYSRIMQEGGLNNIDHLHFAESVVFLSAVSLSLSKRYLIRFFVFMATTLLLFSLGGRASFALYVATFISLTLWEISWREFSATGFTLGSIGIVLFTVVTINYFGEAFLQLSADQYEKMFFYIGDTSDSSADIRTALATNALKYIDEQLLFGNMSIVVKSTGTLGGYVHNLFGLIQMYGLFTFVASVLLTFVVLLKIIKNRFYYLNGHYLIVFMFMYSIVSVLFAKLGTFHFLWLSLGYLLLHDHSKNNSLNLKEGRFTDKVQQRPTR